MQNKNVHICMAIHDADGNYSRYVGVALLSIFEHTEADVVVHLLHDETLATENKERFSSIAESFHQNIIFYDVPVEHFAKASEQTGNYTVGTLFRLILPELLPENIERVIYLDADVLVNLDIAELFAFNLKGKSLAARHDAPCCAAFFPVRSGVVDAAEYFNAGVLLLNLKKIRCEHNLLTECLDYIESNPESHETDQDALNVVFQQDVCYLPEKYNTFTTLLRSENRGIDGLSAVIYHFAGDNVHIFGSRLFDLAYLAYWSKTEWKDSLTALQRKKQVFLSCEPRAIYGRKKVATQFLQQSGVPVQAVIDREAGGTFFGYPVISLEEALSNGIHGIVLACGSRSIPIVYHRIAEQCCAKHVLLFDVWGNQFSNDVLL